jgi:hypothetical protein
MNKSSLISYSISYSIALKEYVDVEHFVSKYIWGRNEQYILKGNVKRQPTQKKVKWFESSISNFFLWKILKKKDDV